MSTKPILPPNLQPLKLLGHGATGTVFLVFNPTTDPSANSPFALKLVPKTTPTTTRRATWEISVLQNLTQKPNPYLPTLLATFETEQFLAWAVPYCPGRDLNVLRHRQNDRVFSPSVIRFYVAEIVCALQHLHGMGIVYRDLKPENVLIQSSGHVTLTDFDLSRALAPKSLRSLILLSEKHERKFTHLTFARVMEGVKLKKAKSARVSPMLRKDAGLLSGERTNSFVGTDEYLAPEVVGGDGHEFAVDWWALGVLCYEMLYGTTPFRGKNRKDTFGRILLMPPKFTGKPTFLTDLISRLLEKEPTRRLGYFRGACEIQEHPFFNGLRWDMLREVGRPPFIPSRDDAEVKMKLDGFDVTEYFEKVRNMPSSPSRDGCRYNVSYREF